MQKNIPEESNWIEDKNDIYWITESAKCPGLDAGREERVNMSKDSQGPEGCCFSSKSPAGLPD